MYLKRPKGESTRQNGEQGATERYDPNGLDDVRGLVKKEEGSAKVPEEMSCGGQFRHVVCPWWEAEKNVSAQGTEKEEERREREERNAGMDQNISKNTALEMSSGPGGSGGNSHVSSIPSFSRCVAHRTAVLHGVVPSLSVCRTVKGFGCHVRGISLPTSKGSEEKVVSKDEDGKEKRRGKGKGRRDQYISKNTALEMSSGPGDQAQACREMTWDVGGRGDHERLREYVLDEKRKGKQKNETKKGARNQSISKLAHLVDDKKNHIASTSGKDIGRLEENFRSFITS
ncbi:hypothetical protein B0H10DRAFT_1949598 [Mycena sp. CBHHK59/15]|nr:hypothetical protein B0H10DRAFT_1949598 [Mycena sp. CBHHK59/15]